MKWDVAHNVNISLVYFIFTKKSQWTLKSFLIGNQSPNLVTLHKIIHSNLPQRALGLHSKPFMFFATYEWAHQARMLHYKMLSWGKHLLGLFVSYQENEVYSDDGSCQPCNQANFSRMFHFRCGCVNAGAKTFLNSQRSSLLLQKWPRLF